MPLSSAIVTEVCRTAVYDHVVIDSIVYLCYKKCVTHKKGMVSHSRSTCSCNFLRGKKWLLVTCKYCPLTSGDEKFLPEGLSSSTYPRLDRTAFVFFCE
jgi:hypothetical protein